MFAILCISLNIHMIRIFCTVVNITKMVDLHVVRYCFSFMCVCTVLWKVASSENADSDIMTLDSVSLSRSASNILQKISNINMNEVKNDAEATLSNVLETGASASKSLMETIKDSISPRSSVDDQILPQILPQGNVSTDTETNSKSHITATLKNNDSSQLTVSEAKLTSHSNISDGISVNNNNPNSDNKVVLNEGEGDISTAGVSVAQPIQFKVTQKLTKVTDSPKQSNGNGHFSTTTKSNENVIKQKTTGIKEDQSYIYDTQTVRAHADDPHTPSYQASSKILTTTPSYKVFSTSTKDTVKEDSFDRAASYDDLKSSLTSGSQFPVALMPGPVLLQPAGHRTTATTTAATTSTWQSSDRDAANTADDDENDQPEAGDNWYGNGGSWDDDDDDINTGSAKKTDDWDFWTDEKLLPQDSPLDQNVIRPPTNVQTSFTQNVRPPKEGLVTANFNNMAAKEAVNMQLDMIAYYSWILIVSLAVISLLLFIRQRHRMGSIWPVTSSSQYSYNKMSAAEEGDSLMKNIYA